MDTLRDNVYWPFNSSEILQKLCCVIYLAFYVAFNTVQVNQYIQLVKVLYCKLRTNGKQLPAFPLEAMLGTEPRSQRWEARVLPLCNRGPCQKPQRPGVILHGHFSPSILQALICCSVLSLHSRPRCRPFIVCNCTLYQQASPQTNKSCNID